MSPTAPIFVVGAPRSGTSLLRTQLDRHPAIALCDETYFFYYVHARRRAFGDLRMTSNRTRAVDRYLETDRVRRLGLDLPALRRALLEADSYPTLFLALMRFYAKERGKRRYGEKTPQHALVADRLLDWYPDARLIHIVRDPRDVVASLLRMPWADRNPVANAWTWRACVEAAESCRTRPGFLQVRYERLVAEPEAELARICAFLGEEFTQRLIEAAPEAKADRWWFQRALGPMQNDRIGRWHEALGPEQVSLVEWAAGPEMAALGYEPVAPRASRYARALALTSTTIEAATGKLWQLPALWYRWAQPTKLRQEEAWLDRRR